MVGSHTFRAAVSEIGTYASTVAANGDKDHYFDCAGIYIPGEHATDGELEAASITFLAKWASVLNKDTSHCGLLPNDMPGSACD